MPILKDRETKKIALKTIEGGEVEVYTSLTAGDAERLNKMQMEGKHIVGPLLIIIKDWNLTNGDGVKLKITEGNIGLLDIKDVNHIADESGISDKTFLAEEPIENGSE